MRNLSLPLHTRMASSRKNTGAKLALKPVHVWGIRLQGAVKERDLALFDLALDSKLCGCNLMAFRVSDVISTSGVRSRVKRGGRCSSRSLSRRAALLRTGWLRRSILPMIGCSRAAASRVLTSVPVNMLGWWTDGCADRP